MIKVEWFHYPDFEPKNNEDVIIHPSHWRDNWFALCEFDAETRTFKNENTFFSGFEIDYWMRIPPIPKE